jgi:hypothetical protein
MSMSFAAHQIEALRGAIAPEHLRRRKLRGRPLSYIEGWYAISEANRIFGFGHWDRETMEARCVYARGSHGTFRAFYVAKVRITVRAGSTPVVREGHGTGDGCGATAGEAHELAIKTAETDATKRALVTFGSAFGLELYRSSISSAHAIVPRQEASEPATDSHVPTISDPPPLGPESDEGGTVSEKSASTAIPPDDLTPIPRPSRFFGLQRYLVERDSDGALVRKIGKRSSRTQASRADRTRRVSDAKIDKSVLAISEPKRLRDKYHLRFVGRQPCLICGRTPSDAHHLRFAQPRGVGLKASDEFTVPLCRLHHREAHRNGDEAAWWEDLAVDAIGIARGLWEQSRAMTKVPASSIDRGPQTTD